ncbi:dihydroorotase, partial [bacterium]|nr:dihydroorotase [bacterium]
VHLREGAALQHTVADMARVNRRIMVMPNLVPPVIDTAAASAYRERIMNAAPTDNGHFSEAFEPLMLLYLTDNTSAAEIERAANSGIVFGAKLYPAGATTNSDAGVTHIRNAYTALEAMQKHGIPLQIHGEVTHENIDIFDREKRFIDDILEPLVNDFPELRITLEHITTKDAVAFIESQPDNKGATITAHHLLYNRNHMLVGGIRPHYYCLPILKRSEHQEALIAAACSGNPKFFLGTDSAPHSKDKKETACGCAGTYTAHAAIELYAEVFEQAGALDKLECFASFYGPDFYGLPRNKDTITLEKSSWTVPNTLPLGDSTLVPLRAGEAVNWRVISP